LPYSAIALENMLKLSKLGIIIAPPVLGYYSNPKDLEEMEDFLIGKWFDLLGIKHDLYKRWKVEDE
jgi:4-hydroxy-3-polyprenylbenzoate decarboxylase